MLQNIIELLLLSTCSIKLKWEPHGDSVVWGEGALKVTDSGISLTRKAMTHSLHGLSDAPEWSTWVDVFSPSTRIVWRSHFPSLLRKCLWYALTSHHVRSNLRSVLWGVGVKGYPKKWWQGQLTKLFHAPQPDRIVPMRGLLHWVKEGRKHIYGEVCNAVGGW